MEKETEISDASPNVVYVDRIVLAPDQIHQEPIDIKQYLAQDLPETRLNDVRLNILLLKSTFSILSLRSYDREHLKLCGGSQSEA